MKFSVVLSTDPTQFNAVAFQGDFEENVARIADIGYAGVELAIRDPGQIDVAAVEQVIARNNLVVPAIGTGQAYGEDKLSFTSPDEAVRAEAMARIKAHIWLAAELEAVVILGLIRGAVPPGVAREQAMGWLVGALRDCASVAARMGVQMVIEPISRAETDLINTIDEGLDLLAAVGADGGTLGLLPDTYHMNIEEASMEESMRSAAGHIFHFHVADSNRRYPGAGDLDFGRILSLLEDDLGYEGWVSAETLPYPDAITAARKGLAHLQASIVNHKQLNRQN